MPRQLGRHGQMPRCWPRPRGGVKLAGVKHISYNSDSRDYDWCVCEAAPAGVPDDGEGDEKTVIEPEPVEVSCSVDVEWWIE